MPAVLLIILIAIPLLLSGICLRLAASWVARASLQLDSAYGIAIISAVLGNMVAFAVRFGVGHAASPRMAAIAGAIAGLLVVSALYGHMIERPNTEKAIGPVRGFFVALVTGVLSVAIMFLGGLLLEILGCAFS